MQITRLYSDEHGETHFADEALTFTTTDFAPPAPPLHISAFVPATQIGFLQEPAGWVGAAHSTPRRQFVIVLAGQFQVQVSDGEDRTFTTGCVLLLEDTAGAGHRSAFLGTDDLRLALVQLLDAS
jgi:hypothetical protein